MTKLINYVYVIIDRNIEGDVCVVHNFLKVGKMGFTDKISVDCKCSTTDPCSYHSPFYDLAERGEKIKRLAKGDLSKEVSESFERVNDFLKDLKR